MTANDDLARRLSDHYGAEAPARAPEWLLESALMAIETARQRRLIPGPSWPTDSRRAVVAAAVFGAFVVGGLLWLGGSNAPSVGGPTPSATPAPTTIPSHATQLVGRVPDVLVASWFADRAPDGLPSGPYELIVKEWRVDVRGLDGTPSEIWLGYVGLVEPDVIELTATADCEGPGTYRWTLGAGSDADVIDLKPTLDFVPIEDTCLTRRSILDGTWQLQARHAYGLENGRRYRMETPSQAFAFTLPAVGPPGFAGPVSDTFPPWGSWGATVLYPRERSRSLHALQLMIEVDPQVPVEACDPAKGWRPDALTSLDQFTSWIAARFGTANLPLTSVTLLGRPAVYADVTEAACLEAGAAVVSGPEYRMYAIDLGGNHLMIVSYWTDTLTPELRAFGEVVVASIELLDE